ncbi:transcription repressor [Bifidobacterium pseudolongum subsp. globosum]|uniref:Transcription repressor n=2 Tax=Bifidobacterium pseudolongum subsp. globosum TaxID=1690 RepID=A0A2N3QV93_9BIFI|nr:GNAT family N-acetyltransferase [Bifidobacterium pseudolongum]KFI78676.1 transcription repressor [Bifidobacterium pseudolongum subsp. globosum]PKU96014.1 transcription repressor [Bifidobacterium pseudolongum subsp. globosum]PKU97048.1 transcription repressor [Bifidobacterium pseudolongum subsp. globosum]PKV02695.1 transcription repressor [Bifidobacterium pseudolongum subsp. globosum]RYP96423.1 transcription repressor [Bifidobacterium pseudolongum subsp. globosum]
MSEQQARFITSGSLYGLHWEITKGIDTMPMIEMAQSTDVNTIRDLSIATFAETFASLNTEEDMEQYNERHFSTDELQREIDNPDSTFVVAKVDGVPAGYMKVNVGDAQTEEMLGNRMEVQRLYILRQYKRNGLGARFMHTAFDMARAQGKSVIWLGVWEHNDAAIAFYKRMGFVQFGSHDFVLGEDRQTDLLMEAAVDRLV